MKTFIAEIIPKIQRFSRRLDELTMLTNQHWVSLGDINERKRVFIFKDDKQLLISDNGIVEKGSWEYLGNQSLLLDTKEKCYLLKHGFFDENVIALKLDSTSSYAFFINETKYIGELNTIDDVINFLEKMYLKNSENYNDLAATQNNPSIKTPKYKIVQTTEKISFFGGATRTYKIEFLDGNHGEIFLKLNSNEAYYKEKQQNLWYTEMHYYESLEQCINALYYYILTGNRSNERYVFTYS